MNDKIIFLDFDGVLNTEIFILCYYQFCKEANLLNPDNKLNYNELIRDEYGSKFDPLALRNLDYIISMTEAKYVISSTWRMCGLSVLLEMWRERGYMGDIIDITPNHMYKTGTTLQRGAEIKEWLSLHPEVSSYCIIDDDSDMLDEQQNCFVQTDPSCGLTFRDATKVIEILNKNNIL